jgi:hypothetical protein
LVTFLRSDVHLNEDALINALQTIDSQRAASVPNVIFTDDEIARLGLAV